VRLGSGEPCGPRTAGRWSARQSDPSLGGTLAYAPGPTTAVLFRYQLGLEVVLNDAAHLEGLPQPD
jgi:hypothetical protein